MHILPAPDCPSPSLSPQPRATAPSPPPKKERKKSNFGIASEAAHASKDGQIKRQKTRPDRQGESGYPHVSPPLSFRSMSLTGRPVCITDEPFPHRRARSRAAASCIGRHSRAPPPPFSSHDQKKKKAKKTKKSKRQQKLLGVLGRVMREGVLRTSVPPVATPKYGAME